MRGGLAALFALMAIAVHAQPSSARCAMPVASLSATEFIACARTGTEKYLDQSAAVADGYRRIGRDFPGMGEHWIRMSLVFDGMLDPARPEILNYIAVDGSPRLLGVAYAVPLLRGEEPPDTPAGRGAWHDHARTIEDETVLPHHHMQGSVRGESRLAMMHAWIWSPNPDGMFAADNWAIPLLRAKLSPAADMIPAVARAVALAGGGRDYFERAIEAAATLTAREKHSVRTALDRAQVAAAAIVGAVRGPVLGEPERTHLASIWEGLWMDVDAAITEPARERIAHLPIRSGDRLTVLIRFMK